MRKNMCILLVIFSFLMISCSSYEASHQVNKQIEFGTYTINSDKNMDPIIWDVIEDYGDKKLLLARNIIDYQKFYTNNKDEKEKLWNNSYLRKWLNTNFYNAAFTEAEKNQMLTNSDYCEIIHTGVDEQGQNNYINKDLPIQTPLCEDKVFLLTYSNIESYKIDKQASTTPYALKKGEFGKNLGLNGYGTWWLSTTQYVTTNIIDYQLSTIGIVTVNDEGKINSTPIDAQKNGIYVAGVRPAIWIKSNN